MTDRATWTRPDNGGAPISGDILAVDGEWAWFRFQHPELGTVLRLPVRLAELVREYPLEGPAAIEFEIAEEGRFSIAPGWRRDDAQTIDRLLMVSIDVSAAEVAAWTDEQVREAQLYAVAAYLSASDNDDIIVPAKPTFLPEFSPFPGVISRACGADHG